MSKCCCFSDEQLPLGLRILTSSIGSTPHSFQATSSTKTVISPRKTGSVVRTGSLHCQQLAWRVVVSAHFRSTTLEDLNVPRSVSTERSQSLIPSTSTSQLHIKTSHLVIALKLAVYFKPGFFTLCIGNDILL